MNFYDLPEHIIVKIYEYDNTYHNQHKKIIKHFKNVFNTVDAFTRMHRLDINQVYSYKKLFKKRSVFHRYIL